ncbi:hypothetical protein TanjilG_02774 [Lupinus angustifolius]|uniref:Gnk2-homologous domain-containing protein n=1 Tax=Lupinus angustifolius TaxID=3871 RepID=A0A1J7HX31_LUPAN|nr:PREDICTED: cysteine-rich repeat secretory protein 56-like [Lupinus angustifolius]OIW05067.1 hypothetical protein TanjilG_02774 [Lupinus angustifolius]
MGYTLRNRYTFLSLLHLFTLSIPFLLLPSASDTTSLIYKGCADQKLPDPSRTFSHTLNSLFSSLLSQASLKNFAAATSGDGATVTGLYQCRGDLSNTDCYNCVRKVTDMVGKLCDADVAAVRVQLSGCYLRYEMVGFKQVPQTQLLYKLCGSKKVNNGVGFDEKRDTAFGMVENGVKSGSNMFYTGSYESLYVLGQCEGDLGNDDCGDCVSSAEQQAKTLCGDSISAQVYLHGCYISYSFYPNRVPTTTTSSSSGSESVGGHQHTNRTVALAVGGFAALGFLIVFMLFLKSALKKKGGKH